MNSQQRRKERIVQTPYTDVNLELQANHAAAVKHTERHANGKEYVRRHNLRLSTMITWIKNNYPEYSDEMIIELAPDRRQDEMFYKATHDFVYDKLHADIVKAFIGGNKIKEISEDGTEIYYSFDKLAYWTIIL